MLGYLDALIAALSMRDAAEIARLLDHPLARLLSADVRDEAAGFRSGARDPLAAPLRTMQLRHQTAELLRDLPMADAAETPAVVEASPEAVVRPVRPTLTRTRRVKRPQQMELPLTA